jgi:FG-GAP-like repeat
MTMMASMFMARVDGVAALWPTRFAAVSKALAKAAAVTALLCAGQPAAAQFTQQGPKLVGTGQINGGDGANEGWSVALSADGNTALVGGNNDNSGLGAVWVFTRIGGVWSQQGSKLLASGATGANVQLGQSVALSADGNTALVGGHGDNNGAGAAWVFTRSGGVWSQQGSKLVGTGAGTSTGANQGWSVALSADGNTALVGGYSDSSFAGAAWVFTRSGSVWSQQGSKLVGTGSVGDAEQGWSVALSGDGNTALVGGVSDNAGNNIGATWVFTRSGGVWSQQGAKLIGTGAVAARQGNAVALSADGLTALVAGRNDNVNLGAIWVFTSTGGVWSQQGSKLVGTGAVGSALQGASVALSADGNTAVEGGWTDNGSVGAVWVFTRSGGVWSQQGSKLVGTGSTGGDQEGFSIALSADGKTLLEGGPADNVGTGAAWVFVQPTVQGANTHDFNGDGKSDIAWRDTVGDLAIWLMNGTTIATSAGVATVPTTWTIVGQRDFDGDGKADLLWRDTSGNTAMWFMNGTAAASSAGIGNIPANWSVVGTADFNGDGKGDILWKDTSGNVVMWLMNGGQPVSFGNLGNVPTSWSIAGTGDFNGDGMADILWRDNLGNIAMWFMNGATVASSAGVGNIPTSWSVVGTGDFNGDGKSDIIWRDNVGDVSIWLMNGATVSSGVGLGQLPIDWQIVETGDFNGDHTSDVLWFNSAFGVTAMWLMNGGQIMQAAGVGFIGGGWTIQSTNVD